MDLSRATEKRWVIDHVDVDAVRYAKTMAARHDVTVHQVLEQAVYMLWDRLADGGELPDGWTELGDV